MDENTQTTGMAGDMNTDAAAPAATPMPEGEEKKEGEVTPEAPEATPAA